MAFIICHSVIITGHDNLIHFCPNSTEVCVRVCVRACILSVEGGGVVWEANGGGGEGMRSSESCSVVGLLLVLGAETFPRLSVCP